MAKSVRVQFEDGTSHVYDNVPDDVDASALETRAAQEFNKPILTAHSPDQGFAPQKEESGAPTFAQYSTLPKTAGQIAGAAAIPLQMAAEHPYETAALAGLYKAGQVGNAYIQGKNVEAEALKQRTAVQAQTAAGNQNIQQQKINLKAGIPPVAGPIAPPTTAAGGMQNLQQGVSNMIGTPAATAQAAQQTAQATQAAAQPSMLNQIRNKAASMVTGLAQANPMLATAGRTVGKVLPGVGAVAGGLEAYNRAQQGDYGQAALAGLGAGASFIPGVGTAINMGTTAINAGIDYSAYLAAKRKYEEQQKAMKR
jgi:hypothetical protein